MGRNHQEKPLLRLNPSPEEQVFSNPLLLNLIWKHLKTQDLLRTSGVSRAWFTKSRKVLMEAKNKHAVCAQIDSHSPCRTLLKLNAFLGETHAVIENRLIYNGIKYLFAPDSFRTLMGLPRCFNCLKNDFIDGDIGEGVDPWWRAAQEQLVMDQLPAIYGNILAKMQFKYVNIHENLSWYCPFTCLIKWCFQRARNHILEFDYGIGYNYSFNNDFFFSPNFSNTNRLEFPSLEVLGLKRLSYIASNETELGINAPSLKRITRFAFDPASPEHVSLRDGFPRHAITNLKAFTGSVQSVIHFVQQYQPKIEVLNFDDNCDPETVVVEDVFRLGSLISATLTKLTCSLSTLKLLVGGLDGVNGNQHNQFLALESLDLHYVMDVEALDWFNGFDFREDFPRLQQLCLGYKVDEIEYDSTVSGPVWVPKLTDDPRFDRITNLTLKKDTWYTHSINASDWLYQFHNVAYLKLTESFFDNKKFKNFMGQIKTLRFLKKLDVETTSLNNVSLDKFFIDNESGMEDKLESAEFQPLATYESSLLYHKSLEHIYITGKKLCTPRINSAGVRRCHSKQKPDVFLVSNRTAKAICKHLPGFKFHITVLCACIPECTSNFYPGGLRLEHLEPHAKIKMEQAPGVKFQRFYEIEFLSQE